MSYSETVVDGPVEKAIDILEGLRTMAYDHMLIQDQYVDADFMDEGRADRKAPCGGHKACVVGSIMLAADVNVEVNREEWGDGSVTFEYHLFDAEFAYRERWLNSDDEEHKPLQIAYHALEAVTLIEYGDVLKERIEDDEHTQYGFTPLEVFDYAPEALFEVHLQHEEDEVIQETIIGIADKAIEDLGGTPLNPPRSYLPTLPSVYA